MEEYYRDLIMQELSAFGEQQVEAEKQIDEKFDTYWNGLSKEEQMAAFYSVVKRIVQAEMKGTTYKKLLWEEFEFPQESYALGILCNFMWLHNHITR
jgi:hypothetical protein